MIRKGEAWGEEIVLRGDERRAATDVEAARLLAAGTPEDVVVLVGGDLHHSLGGRAGGELAARTPGGGPASGGSSSAPVIALPVDLIAVTIDGTTFTGVAHVVARRRWWTGEFAVAMGGTHLGRGNLGPRAHPNDGLLDVTTGRLDLRDRLKARRRAPAGTHVPHPALRTARVRSDTWTFERPTTIRVDGVAVARTRHVELEALPDRGRVVVG